VLLFALLSLILMLVLFMDDFFPRRLRRYPQ